MLSKCIPDIGLDNKQMIGVLTVRLLDRQIDRQSRQQLPIRKRSFSAGIDILGEPFDPHIQITRL